MGGTISSVCPWKRRATTARHGSCSSACFDAGKTNTDTCSCDTSPFFHFYAQLEKTGHSFGGRQTEDMLWSRGEGSAERSPTPALASFICAPSEGLPDVFSLMIPSLNKICLSGCSIFTARPSKRVQRLHVTEILFESAGFPVISKRPQRSWCVNQIPRD